MLTQPHSWRVWATRERVPGPEDKASDAVWAMHRARSDALHKALDNHPSIDVEWDSKIDDVERTHETCEFIATVVDPELINQSVEYARAVADEALRGVLVDGVKYAISGTLGAVVGALLPTLRKKAVSSILVAPENQDERLTGLIKSINITKDDKGQLHVDLSMSFEDK